MAKTNESQGFRGYFEWFVHSEVTGSVLLLACTITALVWANSPWANVYHDLLHTYIGVGWGDTVFKLNLHHWINDGLMVVFFFVVGLEVKRELVVGELSSFEKASLPVAAALGGMVVPAVLYAVLNVDGAGARGWGIPMATDIAFVVGCLAVLGKRIPGSLRILLLSLLAMSGIGFLESFLLSFAAVALFSLLIIKLFRDFSLWRTVDLDLQAQVRRATPRLGWKALAGIMVVAVVVALLAARGIMNSLVFDAEPNVMAHRGASAHYPENTLAAIQGAIDAGAQYVEIDVQETADGEIVVIHDSDLKKVGGVPLVVGESTLQQLGYTDIGSWFDLSFSDQRIPTLREVLALCKDRIRVNIELKYYGHERRLEQSVA